MSRRRIYKFSVVVAVLAAVLAALLEVLRELLVHAIWDDPGVRAWFENHLPSAGALLLALAALVVASIALRAWQHSRAESLKKTTHDTPPLDPALRPQLLDKIQRERVGPRLRQGLRRAIRINLGLTETPDAVQPKLRAYVTSESATVTDRPIEGPIQDIFIRAGGRLLILGEPGTGKTNILLELAERLITEAKRDEARPIPAVFNLSRWTLGKNARTLREWLEDDLRAEYGLSGPTADALITQNRILPLLDGLDEVSKSRRAGCVDAIHAFQQERDLGSLVVCCRTEEYASLPRLDLGTAVRVEKLVRADIERQIAGPHLKRVRQALQSDPHLWEIVDTPLWLHVLYHAAQVEPPKGSEGQSPRDRLHARFVIYALGRETEGSPRKRTAGQPLLRWLRWLAVEMRSRGQSQFAFEDLDWSWLPSKRAQSAARWVAGFGAGVVLALVGGLLGALVGGLVIRSAHGLVQGLVLGLVGALVFGLACWDYPSANFQATEELYFSWRDWRRALVVSLANGLVGGLILGLVFGLALPVFVGWSLSWAAGWSLGWSQYRSTF